MWLNAIEDAVDLCHRQFEVMKKKCSAVLAINLLLLDDPVDEEQMLEMLQTDVLQFAVIDECISAYAAALFSAHQEKVEAGGVDSGCITEVIDNDNSLFYFDTNKFTGHWSLQTLSDSSDMSPPTSLLSSDEIEAVLATVTHAFNKIEVWRSNERFLIRIQAAVRMFIQKRRFQTRLRELEACESSVIVIQAFFRGWRTRRRLAQRKHLWHKSIKEIVTIQSLFRMLRCRRRYLRRLEHFAANEEAIVRIQSWWRGCYVRNDYQGLSGSVARLGAVRHFVHLLDRTLIDLEEEDAICRLKKEIIRRIRENDELETALNQMDVKIGKGSLFLYTEVVGYKNVGEM